MKGKSRILSLPIMILFIGMCVSIALFAASLAPRSKAFATGEVEVTATKYITSKTGDYIVFATAFNLDDVGEGTYVIGYTIDGVDYNTQTYYEAIRLKSGEGSVRYDVEDIFDISDDSYKLIALEIPYNVAHNYGYKAFVRKVTPGAGFPADLSDYETITESAGTTYSSHRTLATPVLSIDEDGITWGAVAGATDYQVTVNGGSPTTTGGGRMVELESTTGDYEVSVVALGNGGKIDDSAAAEITYHIADAAITVTSTNNNPTATWTTAGIGTELSDDGENFVEYNANTVTTINSAPIWIRAIDGWDGTTNTLYKDGGANQTKEYLAKVKDGNDLILETSEYANASQIFGWTKHKYENSGWVAPSANVTIGLGDDYLAEGKSIEFKPYINGVSFRFGKTMGTLTSDTAYKAVAFDIKLHDDTSNSCYTTVQIMTSIGVYMNYRINTNLSLSGGQWYHVEISLTDSNWQIPYGNSSYNPGNIPSAAYSLLGVSGFDDVLKLISNIYFTTSGANANYSQKAYYLDNLKLLGGNSAIPTSAEELNPPTPDPVDLYMDFGTYTSNASYSNASWTQYVGNNPASGQMNVREGNTSGNAVVNMYADTNVRRYAYNYGGSTLGLASYFSVKLGNYFNSGAINYKIVIVDTEDNEIYIAGSAGAYETLAKEGSNSLGSRVFTTLQYNFPETAVKYFYFVTNMGSGTNYLYMDDLKLNNTDIAPDPGAIDLSNYSSVAEVQDFQGYNVSSGSALSNPAGNVTSTRTLYVRNDSGDGYNSSGKYASAQYASSGTASASTTTITYSLNTQGIADSFSFAIANNRNGNAKQSNITVKVYDVNNELVALTGDSSFSIASGAGWALKTVSFDRTAVKKVEIVISLGAQGSGDAFMKIDNLAFADSL